MAHRLDRQTLHLSEPASIDMARSEQRQSLRKLNGSFCKLERHLLVTPLQEQVKKHVRTSSVPIVKLEGTLAELGAPDEAFCTFSVILVWIFTGIYGFQAQKKACSPVLGVLRRQQIVNGKIWQNIIIEAHHFQTPFPASFCFPLLVQSPKAQPNTNPWIWLSIRFQLQHLLKRPKRLKILLARVRYTCFAEQSHYVCRFLAENERERPHCIVEICLCEVENA